MENSHETDKPVAWYAHQNDVHYIGVTLKRLKHEYPYVGNWTPLYAHPPQQVSRDDLKDAQRYRALRRNVAPADVAFSMDVPCPDLGKDEQIEDRIDALCDGYIRAMSTPKRADK